jgi:hypothetical protein
VVEQGEVLRHYGLDAAAAFAKLHPHSFDKLSLVFFIEGSHAGVGVSANDTAMGGTSSPNLADISTARVEYFVIYLLEGEGCRLVCALPSEFNVSDQVRSYLLLDRLRSTEPRLTQIRDPFSRGYVNGFQNPQGR